MTEFMTFLVSHGYIIIFVWVFLDQAGLPLPAAPLLLAAGALVGIGQLDLALVFATCVFASVPVDFFWYLFGRKRGAMVLNLLCAISLEPDYCVRNTESTFDKLGPLSLIVAKFVPGLQTLAPPMSGLTGMSVPKFLILDTIGVITWTAAFAGLGLIFSDQLEAVAMRMADIGFWAGFFLISLVIAWFGGKLYQRQRFLRSLEMRRLEPREVFEKMQNEDNLHIIDLRHSYDVDRLPEKVPTAVSVPMEALERHAHRIPRESDIILYCS